MNAPDYHDISTSIAEIIAKTSKPLVEQQKIALVGSVSIWLLQRDQRIEKLEAALKAILAGARGTATSVNDCLVSRQLLGEARALMERESQ